MTLRDQLQAALGTAYSLDQELEGGGMSRVFVATETALGRRIVVKVLHPELAAEVTAERFAREIQLVARLQQANIVPLITTGHTGEVPFYTMPFVEGLSLRKRLSDAGRLPIQEAIAVLRDVARALAYAHDAGVVHRDIKPENVLLSGGTAVVTDFGIAKAIATPQRQRITGTGLTLTGAGIGTPAYMAPEQVSGDPKIDHRADLYAYGCLAYELLTGHPPFRANSVQELLAAQMMKTPASLSDLRPDAPPRLTALVMRCLEKQADARPQTARELLEALDSASRASAAAESMTSGASRRPAVLIAAVAVIVVASSVYLAMTRDRSTAVAASEGPAAIAVIPFANVGGDSANDYLADGLSDELATALGKVSGVRVASRSGAYRYRGRRDVDVRSVGTELRVRYVVQGTVRPSGDQLRISAQLTDAATGVELWSNAFDRSARDVFRTQDEITAAIANALPLRSGPPQTTRRPGGDSAVNVGGSASKSTRGTNDVEAYNLYLRGEFALRLRRISTAADMFRQAAARDARFARAHAGLAQAYALAPYFISVPVDSAMRMVEASSRRALELDATLAEPYLARGMARMHAWRWNEALEELRRAIAVNPRHVESQFQLGRLYYYLGADDSAAAAWNRAKAVDPFSPLAIGWHAQLLAVTGRSAEARVEVLRMTESDTTSAVTKQLAARVYHRLGDSALVRRFSIALPSIEPWNGMAAFFLAQSGDPERARTIIRGLESARPRPWFVNYSLALGYLGLGDTSRTLAALERATDAREIWPTYNRVQDPMFDVLRRSARWQALMRRVGLQDAPGAAR